MMFAGVFLLIVSGAMLAMGYKPNPNEYNKLEQAVDPTGSGHTSNFTIMAAVLVIAVSATPGVLAAAALAYGQLEIGSIVLLMWAYPYWLLLNYFNKRSLLKVRLGFSLTVTFLMLVFAFYISKPSTSSTNSTLTNKTISATHAKTKQPN